MSLLPTADTPDFLGLTGFLGLTAPGWGREVPTPVLSREFECEEPILLEGKVWQEGFLSDPEGLHNLE